MVANSGMMHKSENTGDQRSRASFYSSLVTV